MYHGYAGAWRERKGEAAGGGSQAGTGCIAARKTARDVPRSHYRAIYKHVYSKQMDCE